MSWASVETMLVKAWHASQGLFVEINKADFDPAKHEIYVAETDVAAKAKSDAAAIEAAAKAEAEKLAANVAPPPAPVEVAPVPVSEVPAPPAPVAS